jgi:hypothetical protein
MRGDASQVHPTTKQMALRPVVPGFEVQNARRAIALNSCSATICMLETCVRFVLEEFPAFH